MIRRGFIAAAAGWAAIAGMAAEAQTTVEKSAADSVPCLTTEDAEAAVLVMIPGALHGLQTVCGPKLPANSYLATRGAALEQRFRDAGAEVGPAADRAVTQIMGVTSGEPVKDAAKILEPMSEMMVLGAKKDLDARNCALADEMLGLLDPLPARNFSRILERIVELGSEGDKDPPFRVCPKAKG